MYGCNDTMPHSADARRVYKLEILKESTRAWLDCLELDKLLRLTYDLKLEIHQQYS